jgi:hypothetical protein
VDDDPEAVVRTIGFGPAAGAGVPVRSAVPSSVMPAGGRRLLALPDRHAARTGEARAHPGVPSVP